LEVAVLGLLGGRSRLLIVGVTGMLLAACAAPAGEGDAARAANADAAGQAVGERAEPTAVVPDLAGRSAATIDKMAARAGVVPVVDHDAGVARPAGTVVAVDPAAGTTVLLGSTIRVTVAGAPGGTLDDLIAADRRSFVGLGVDPDGTLVVAVADRADVDAALRRIGPKLAGRKHRTVHCGTSWTELARVTVEVTRRGDLRAVRGFAVTIDPASCAVRVEGDIPADVAAALRTAYPSTVVVKSIGAAQRAPRR
jgi:PASTA domain